jgi:hypothetical protein
MKRWSLRFAVGVLVVALSSSAHADIGQFVGKWKNVNSNTGGVTTLEISLSGDKVKVHAWGRCHPTDCDWGTVDATAYGRAIDSHLPGDAQTLEATFYDSIQVIIDLAEGNKLRVEVLDRSRAGSGKSSFSFVETFSRGAGR